MEVSYITGKLFIGKCGLANYASESKEAKREELNSKILRIKSMLFGGISSSLDTLGNDGSEIQQLKE